jgi:DNA invertase Pin-like site-specific DNA recombinase
MADRRQLRAALYHRVSTREQNPRLARAELRAAAAARGLRVVLEVEEVASGRGSVRPGLDRVLDAAQGGSIEVVMMQRLDRWGRSTLDLLANLRRLRSAGVGFVAIAQGLEVRHQADAVSDLTLTVLAAVAEFERAVIVERTLDPHVPG